MGSFKGASIEFLTSSSNFRVYRGGRALGLFIFSLIGLKRIFFANIFQKL